MASAQIGSRMTLRTYRVDVPLDLVRNTGLAEFRNNPLFMNQDSIGCACTCASASASVLYHTSINVARICHAFLTTASGRMGTMIWVGMVVVMREGSGLLDPDGTW